MNLLNCTEITLQNCTFFVLMEAFFLTCFLDAFGNIPHLFSCYVSLFDTSGQEALAYLELNTIICSRTPFSKHLVYNE